jgi:hypothetical protein
MQTSMFRVLASTSLSPQRCEVDSFSASSSTSRRENSQSSANGDQESSLELTESNLWMKSVIDVIHDDIQSRSQAQTDSVKEGSSGSSFHGSLGQSSKHSRTDDKTRDSCESKRIERFMADDSLPVVPIEISTERTDVRRRSAQKLDELDEVFKCTEKNKPS